MAPRRGRQPARILLALAALGVSAALATGAGAGDWIPCSEEDVDPPTTTSAAPPACTEPEPAPPPPPTGTTGAEETPPPAVTESVPPAATAPVGTTEIETEPARTPAPAPAQAPDPKSDGEGAARPASTPGPLPGSRIARPPQTITPPLGGGPYVFPVLGSVSYTDTWGAARATVAWHHGVDIFAPLGAPIVAVADGTVLSVGWNAIGGWRLWLRDREGNFFYYAHLSAFSKRAVDGARVAAGTVLGFVGNTGDAAGTPYHLHFEIHPVSLLSLGYDGAVNPTPYLADWQRLDAASAAVSLAAGVRWGDSWPQGRERARPKAPPAAAVLLGYADISTMDDPSAAALASPELEPAALAAPEAEPVPEEAEAAPAPAALDPTHVEIARRLDAEAARPATFGGGVWTSLAECEAGGDWSANTGNGYHGGLQFHPQTWNAHGGLEYAETADRATPEEQIAVAARVLVTQGWNAWPVCSRALGLR